MIFNNINVNDIIILLFFKSNSFHSILAKPTNLFCLPMFFKWLKWPFQASLNPGRRLYLRLYFLQTSKTIGAISGYKY